MLYWVFFKPSFLSVVSSQLFARVCGAYFSAISSSLLSLFLSNVCFSVLLAVSPLLCATNSQTDRDGLDGRRHMQHRVEETGQVTTTLLELTTTHYNCLVLSIFSFTMQVWADDCGWTFLLL